MKKYMVFMATILFAISLSAQETEVPLEVKDALTRLYPKAQNVKWDKEKAEQFEAEFMDNGVKTSVLLNIRGEVEEVETVISQKVLPVSILEYVKKYYKDYEISEAARIENEKGTVTYEVEISKGKEKKDLYFDEEGHHLEMKPGVTESPDKDENIEK